MFKKILIINSFFYIFINFAIANIEIKARTAILQDFLSGEILYEKEADESIYPASMTKIMTAIIAFDLIKSGDLNFDVKARTAILQDYYSGEILYEKDPDISIYPASMTKIMTAIIALI